MNEIDNVALLIWANNSSFTKYNCLCCARLKFPPSLKTAIPFWTASRACRGNHFYTILLCHSNVKLNHVTILRRIGPIYKTSLKTHLHDTISFEKTFNPLPNLGRNYVKVVKKNCKPVSILNSVSNYLKKLSSNNLIPCSTKN